jgi:NADH dehydrogenase [ubiquinone] 1 alpha subcomplex assembly factor 1
MSVQMIFDFARPETAGAWWPMGDLVMGGCSESQVEGNHGTLIFSGYLALVEGRGFASIRSPAGIYDLQGFSGLVCLVRGDGRSYKLGLRTETVLDGTVYLAPFIAPAGEWCDILLPFAAFHPFLHGAPVDAPPLAPGAIRSFGLILADGREGPFRLEIAAIRVAGEGPGWKAVQG